MGSSYNALVGPIPDARTLQWDVWYWKLLNARIAYCPLVRATTYYFSQSGNDTTGNGTQGNPYKSIAKAQALHDAAADPANIAFLFKRGDEWNEATGFDVTKKNITVADYGTGAKPLFNKFTIKYNASGWTQAGATNRWTRTEASTIAWVRNQAARLTSPYQRMSSTAGVESTPLSWYWVGTTLHVNVGVGVNPNTLNLESVADNQTVSGLSMGNNADGCRFQNMRADGWGMNTVGANPQKMGITDYLTGTNAGLLVGCESYYSSTHVMAHNSGAGNSGGISTYIDCHAGYGQNVPFGITVFNTYSDGGLNETIFHDCVAEYGILPSDDWVGTAYNSTTLVDINPSAFGLYGHIGSGPAPMSLLVSYNMDIPSRAWGCSAGAFGIAGVTDDLNNILNCTVFVINETHSPGRLGDGIGMLLASPGMVRRGCRYEFFPPDVFGGTLSSSVGGWTINCSFDYNMSQQTWYTGHYYTTVPNQYYHQFLHSQLSIRNYPTNRYWVGIDVSLSSNNKPVIENSIMTADATSNPWFDTLPGATFAHNAYYNVSTLGTNRDSTAILSLDNFRTGYVPTAADQLYQAGANIGVSIDAQQRPRLVTAPDVGPISSLVTITTASSL